MVVSDGGVAGESAIEMGIGLSAHAAVLDNDTASLERLARHSGNILDTMHSTAAAIGDFNVCSGRPTEEHVAAALGPDRVDPGRGD
jgi:alanine dehydrogenase